MSKPEDRVFRKPSMAITFISLSTSNFKLTGFFLTDLQESDGSHIIFINTIQNNFSDIITRTFINITFACRYPINYMVQQPNGENKISVDIR